MEQIKNLSRNSERFISMRVDFIRLRSYCVSYTHFLFFYFSLLKWLCQEVEHLCEKAEMEAAIASLMSYAFPGTVKLNLVTTTGD